MVVRTSEEGKFDETDINRLPVSTANGTKVPLGALAKVQRDGGPNTISRENVQRKIVVSCNVAGRDVGSVVADIQKRIAERVPLGKGSYSGYYVQYGGQFESAQAASRMLMLLGIAVVVCIALLLHMAFHSVRDALLVMLNLPLALIGGVAGVFISGGVLSVASLVGFITLFGIATRNGIMLISHIRYLQKHEGVTNFREAVRRGSMERLAPVLMTALTAGLGLVPLALSGSQPGNEIQTPLAIVVVFGLFSFHGAEHGGRTGLVLAVGPVLRRRPPTIRSLTCFPRRWVFRSTTIRTRTRNRRPQPDARRLPTSQ